MTRPESMALAPRSGAPAKPYKPGRQRAAAPTRRKFRAKQRIAQEGFAGPSIKITERWSAAS